MFTKRACFSITASALLVCGLGAAPAAADDVADFYKDKTVTIVVGHQTGTGFDIYARVLAQHFGRHIPGNPKVAVQNMVGASALVAANWLYNVAPRDGTVIATFVHTVPFEPLFGNKSAKLDPSKLIWIGNMEESIGLCGVTKASGVDKFDDLFVKEVVFGATGASGPLAKFANSVKNLTGAKMKIVQGYKGSASVKVAMEQGEVHGICGLPLSTVKSFWRDDYKSGNFKPVIQLSGKKNKELGNIPHINDYAKTDDDKKVFGLIFGAQVLGRPFVSPPDVPAERIKALREAFLATLKDPQFVADADKAQITIDAVSGEEVAELVASYSAVSPAVVERAKKAFQPKK
jgi:tripartite-type tricarboxylate transporter receptor subunit TctC